MITLEALYKIIGGILASFTGILILIFVYSKKIQVFVIEIFGGQKKERDVSANEIDKRFKALEEKMMHLAPKDKVEGLVRETEHLRKDVRMIMSKFMDYLEQGSRNR